VFVERTRTALEDLMARRLEDTRLAVTMLDGLDIANRCHLVALGITADGVKIPLGLWEASTENATLARPLLADPVDRGLDPDQAILFVLDGGEGAAHGHQGRAQRDRVGASRPPPQGTQRV
jgi:transposase-like protein